MAPPHWRQIVAVDIMLPGDISSPCSVDETLHCVSNVDDNIVCSSSRGYGFPCLYRHLRYVTSALLSLRQQSSLLPVLSHSLVALHRRAWPSPVSQTEQLQPTQSVAFVVFCNQGYMLRWGVYSQSCNFLFLQE